MSSAALRRAAQFFRATFARVRAGEYDLIQARLSPAQVALFACMRRSDQRHCLDVYYTLCRAAYREEDLLRAALLHDAAKSTGAPMTVFHRVAIVLLQAFTLWDLGPRWLARLAADGRGWKVSFA
ncbi:MAG: hypothetical protein JSV36_02115, partial [Anaerolineae bacterium]